MKQALIYITSILIGITLISMIVYGILDILVSFNLTENNTIINIRLFMVYSKFNYNCHTYYSFSLFN